ncbi:flagellar hook assembly protein FlgD [Desulfuromonas thiophila]|uniref:Basal-body rod modification protein FlgD n=1 Tax=Desulfuromonas thiophila TaxID=57664 RepID=A0A1G6X7V4_9BACT|nr:flagellar hook capping FlgD N-terminal domain-containing protein [Desulfuromonas thiophila]SDD74194.1 flagellar basal-body rod modification protein FlgD [Desulfuromonas thiophila]
MSISVISESLSSYSSSSTSGTSSLGQEDFLELLIAQLQNQDPLEPQSNTEFIAQLATFSNVEQASLTNDKLDQVITAAVNDQQFASLNLLDQQVVAQTSSFSLSAGEPVEVGFGLTTPATDVTLSILDSDNAVVNTFSFSDVAAGQTFFSWDGTDADGNALASGSYQMVVNAGNGGNLLAEEEALPLVRAIVTEVDLSGSSAVLLTAAGQLDLADLYNVGGQ